MLARWRKCVSQAASCAPGTQLEDGSLDLPSAGEARVLSVFTGPLAATLCFAGHPTVALSIRRQGDELWMIK